MSNYSKSTNFATKDTLSTGNPSKIVKGTELDAEFNAIVTAIASKLDNTNGTNVSVVQIVSVPSDATFTTTSGTYVSTGHTATITPSSASSKILVILSANLAQTSTNLNTYLTITTGSGTTNLAGGGNSSFADVLSSAGNTYTNIAVNYLHSPATTSATTYRVDILTTGTGVYNSPGSVAPSNRAVLTLIEVL
jgi:hypothetical protein